MVTHGDEEVEEEFSAAFHLSLHGPAPLERLAAPDDQGEVVGAEPRVRVGRVVVGVLGRPQDGGDIDAALQALLAEGQALEFLETELVGGAVHDCVAEQMLAGARDEHCGLDGSAAACVVVGGFGGGGRVRRPHGVLELPRVAALVVQQAGIVVALIEVLEDGGEGLGFLVGQGDALGLGLEILLTAGLLEEGRLAQHLLMGGEQPALATDGQGDDGRVEGPLRREGVLNGPLQLRHLLRVGPGIAVVARVLICRVRPLQQPRRLVDAVRDAVLLGSEGALEHDGGAKRGRRHAVGCRDVCVCVWMGGWADS